MRLESVTKPKKSFLPNEGDLRRAEPPPEPNKVGAVAMPVALLVSLGGAIVMQMCFRIS